MQVSLLCQALSFSLSQRKWIIWASIANRPDYNIVVFQTGRQKGRFNSSRNKREKISGPTVDRLTKDNAID
jgi:hypothetical protein